MEKLKKIGIIGTQCVGKSTLIEDMKTKWPMFKSPDKTYRDLIKEKKLPVNKEGTKEAQELILNSLVDEVMQNYGKQKMVFDRTVIDNMVYSLWLYEKGLGNIDESFIDKTVNLVRNSIKFYSIIFYIPFCEENDVTLTSAPLREVDPMYRSEIGHLFEGIFKAWEKGGSRFFETDDCPAFIPVYGTREERIALMSLYIGPEGEFFGEKDSIVTDFLQQEFIRKNLIERK